MRPSLSRNLCRRLLASHGSFSPASALYVPGPTSQRPSRPRRAPIRLPCRRTFLGILNKPPREVRDAGFEPGFSTFVDFQAHTFENLKPPSREDLVEAFRLFFNYKTAHKRPVNTSQAFVSRLVVEYLQRGDSETPALDLGDLRKALDAIARPLRTDESQNHVAFAEVLYTEIRALKLSAAGKKRSYREDRYDELCSEELERYISVLTRFGATDKAADLLSNFEGLVSRFNLEKPNKLSELHMLVLRGYSPSRFHRGIGCTKQEWQSRSKTYANKLLAAGFGYLPVFHATMTSSFAELDHDAEGELRYWFQKPIAGEKMATPDAYLALIKFSFRTDRQPEWLVTAMQTLCDSNPPKPWWDIILKWALYQGKDISDVKHMIDVMVQLNQRDESVRVDIFTVNGLLAIAVEAKKALLAERANALASEMGLMPTARTYALLLEARIIGQDNTGAASAFEDLIHCGPFYSGSKFNEVANMYIKYLCSGTWAKFEEILSVLSRVERQQGELEPETVVALCTKFLKDDKIMEVIDTLGLHLKQFSMAERRLVREQLVSYCLDKAISTARAWDCYSLLRQFFPETSRAQRMQLMEGFFGRKRADMASRIFGHMRAHPDDAIRPDLDAYVACLEGLGAYPDSDSLNMIHNMFKMDNMIQPDTRLYNAFMIAYTGCKDPQRAFDFWRQITNSQEGPTYRSLELIFRACQILPYGYDKAKIIWERMERLEVDVPAHVYDAYILMAAGQGKLDKVKDMLLSRQTGYDAEPTDFQYVPDFSDAPLPGS